MQRDYRALRSPMPVRQHRARTVEPDADAQLWDGWAANDSVLVHLARARGRAL